VEDQSAPIPKERTIKLGGVIYIVRHGRSRINQATLEKEVGTEGDAQ